MQAINEGDIMANAIESDYLEWFGGRLDDITDRLPCLRDRFAMAALQGLLASDIKVNDSAEIAYVVADKMLAERNK
jgi:hypothetical protein